MANSGTATLQRAHLADTLASLAPHAPTLCEGWDCAALAAHIVLRDRRPDTGPGLVWKPLAGYTERAVQKARLRPYDELVSLVRSKPRLSPTRLRVLDDLANTIEFTIHIEDARRGSPGWPTRALDPRVDDYIWRHIRLVAGGLAKRCPMPFQIVLPDGRTHGEPGGVVMAGELVEIVLFGSGRKDAAQVTFTGPQDGVAALRDAKLGV